MIASAMAAPRAACQIRSGSSSHERSHDQHRCAERHRRVRDLSWQPLGVQVDPDLCHERCAHDAERNQRDVSAELQTERHEECGGRRLDDQRLRADRSAAVTALPAQGHPAPDRHQIECRQSIAARAARARRLNHRTATRHAIDHHGQERADQQTHHGAGNQNQCRLHLVSTLGPVGRRGREL